MSARASKYVCVERLWYICIALWLFRLLCALCLVAAVLNPRTPPGLFVGELASYWKLRVGSQGTREKTRVNAANPVFH